MTLFAANGNGVYSFSTTALPNPDYLLSILRNGTGTGSVSYKYGYTLVNGYFPQQTTITCPGTCSSSYSSGTMLDLVPLPDAGSVFAGWSGCDAVVGNTGDVCRVALFSAKNVTATFNRDTRSLSVMAYPSGGVYATAPTITLGASKDASIYYTLDSSTPTAGSTKYTGPFSLGGPQTVKFIAIDPFSTASAVKTEIYTIDSNDNTLTVTPSGSGGGNVNSTAPQSGLILCSKPPQQGDICSTPLLSGTQVTLTATPDTNSLFGGWGGDCGNPACVGKLFCSITMDSNKTCTATFTYVKPARIDGSNPLREYDSLQVAYDDPLTLDGAIILAREFTFIENLNLKKTKRVTIKGGFDPDYNTRPGYSLLKGIMTVGKGSVVIDRLTVK
jgi:hypothetical protein